MYILKTKGTDKIPDYIQIRDENFVLITHIKANSCEKTLKKHLNNCKLSSVLKEIKKLKFGELLKIK